MNVTEPCPCGSGHTYMDCCGPFISSQKIPQTPEQLMRSRYTAYTLADIAYIKSTMQGKAAIGFNEAEARNWAQRVTWTGLRIIRSSQKDASNGLVEFVASFVDQNQPQTIHEKSLFYRKGQRWYYVDGIH